MTQAKHTPGPWSWRHLPSDRGPEWMVLQVGGLTVEAPSKLVYIACHQADQHLMVAAPELLEALKQFIDEKVDYMRINNLGDPEQTHTVKCGRAAIAKAEGQS